MNNTNLESSASSNVAAAAYLTMILGLAIALTFLYVLPVIIATWKLFAKAGRPGWYAIVPVLGMWTMSQIGKSPSWKFWLWLGAFGVGWLTQNTSVLNMLADLVTLVATILLLIDFAKAYDRRPGFWFLLWLLPIVGVFKVHQANLSGAAEPVAATAAPQL